MVCAVAYAVQNILSLLYSYNISSLLFSLLYSNLISFLLDRSGAVDQVLQSPEIHKGIYTLGIVCSPVLMIFCRPVLLACVCLCVYVVTGLFSSSSPFFIHPCVRAHSSSVRYDLLQYPDPCKFFYFHLYPSLTPLFFFLRTRTNLFFHTPFLLFAQGCRDTTPERFQPAGKGSRGVAAATAGTISVAAQAAHHPGGERVDTSCGHPCLIAP